MLNNTQLKTIKIRLALLTIATFIFTMVHIQLIKQETISGIILMILLITMSIVHNEVEIFTLSIKNYGLVAYMVLFIAQLMVCSLNYYLSNEIWWWFLLKVGITVIKMVLFIGHIQVKNNLNTLKQNEQKELEEIVIKKQI